jgi:hypothetical protein
MTTASAFLKKNPYMCVSSRIEELEHVSAQRAKAEIPETEAQKALAKAAYPQMQTYQMWLEGKQLKPVEKRKSNWNGVSIGRLLTGK